MKYIETFENFKPIVIKSAKPMKIKKDLNNSMLYLRKNIKNLRKRLAKDVNSRTTRSRSDMNRDINSKVKKLSDLNFKNLKQIEYLKNNPIDD